MRLTVVVASRNDDHGGDQLHRMEVFVHSLVELGVRHGLDAELIFVDWNPPPKKKRLVTAICWPADFGPMQIRVITVPSREHKKLAHSDILPLYQMIAKNVGIRRARGDWVLCTNPDLVFPDELVEFLAQADLDPDCYYRATRHDLSQSPPLMDVDWLLQVCRSSVSEIQAPRSLPHTNACGDFTLLHRDQWLQLGGYLEYELWSPHIDSLLLYAAYAMGLREVVLDWPIYHPRHAQSWAVERLKDRPMLSGADVEGMQRAYTPNNLQVIGNQPGWGMVDVKLKEEEVKPGRRNWRKQREKKPQLDGWTVFSVPHHCQGLRALHQENAIRSWLELSPSPEVLLFGDSEGVAQLAETLGCVHIPDVKSNDRGTLFLSDVFGKAQKLANHELMCFINADIVVFPDLTTALVSATNGMDGRFMMTGLRWDTPLDWPISFVPGWPDRVIAWALQHGRRHTQTGADWFAFWRGLYLKIPPFLVGRMAWDNWLILNAMRRGVPVIDATKPVFVIHQEHVVGSGEGRAGEIAHNLRLWGLCEPTGSDGGIESATWVLDESYELIGRSP